MVAPGVSKFFAAIISAISQFPPPPPQPAADIEDVTGVDADQDHSPSFTEKTKCCPPPPPSLNWSKLVIAFCFGSALEIAHQSRSQLPTTLSYFLLCFAISVSFSCIFVAKFIGSKFCRAVQVLENLGVFFAVTAFFLAITSPFPVNLKCTIWGLYALSLLAIVIFNLLV